MKSSDQYFLYTRRSTDDPDNQQNSIAYQTLQGQLYSERLHLPLASLTERGFCTNGIIEERHTAFKTAQLEIAADGMVRYKIERPKFQRLIALLAGRGYKGVIVLCWDRLSRNPQDDGIIKDLTRRGVDVRFVQATYDKTSAGALHMDIDGMFAAHYSRVTSEKILATYSKLRAEGKCTYRSPIGYLDQGPADKPLDPSRAPTVLRIFELYATGEWSFARLAHWARQQGLTTKAWRARRSPDEILDGANQDRPQLSRPVTDKTIENILGNPFYAGWLKNRSELLPGMHEPLISKELFARVRGVLHHRTVSVNKPGGTFFTYRGLLRCVCTRGYCGYEQKGHAYYRVRCRSACAMMMVNLPEHRLDELSADLLGRVCLTDAELAELADRAPRELPKLTERRVDAQGDAERRRGQLQRDLSYLADNKISLLREGVYAMADFRSEYERLETELGNLDRPMSALEETSPSQMLEAVFQFTELLKVAQQSFEMAPAQEKREMLLSGFTELVLNNGKIADVRGKDGFKKLLERHSAPSGAPDYVFTELPSIYNAIQHSLGSSAWNRLPPRE